MCSFSLFLQCRLVMITHSTVYSFCSCTGFEMLICELCSHLIIKLENGSHPNKTLCKERTRAFQIHVKHATQECNLPWDKATKIKHERLHSSHWLRPSSWSSAGGWAQLWPLISAIEAIAHHRYLKSLIRQNPTLMWPPGCRCCPSPSQREELVFCSFPWWGSSTGAGGPNHRELING